MTSVEWTEASFEAAHHGPFGDQIHGHTWHVRIFWPSLPQVDARWMLAKLSATIEAWDHTLLDDKVTPTNYGVAVAIGDAMPDVTQVEVWRGGRQPCGARFVR